MSEVSYEEEESVDVIFEKVDEVDFSSGEERPMSQWSSLLTIEPSTPAELGPREKKEIQYALTPFPRSLENICTAYIAVSDSTVLGQPYYNYPAVTDPGIQEALFQPEKPKKFSDDGQDLYLHLCSEMDTCVVRTFHKNLLTPEINLRYYCVEPKGVRAMAMALSFNIEVRRLDLTDNFLSDDACYHLGRMLVTNIAIEELVLAGCKIGFSGIQNLGAHLHQNTTLKILNLARNNLGEKGAETLAKQIQGTVLEHLNLSCNELGQHAALALGSEVFQYGNLTHIDLSRNLFTHIPSAVKMIDFLKTSTDLVEINLSGNNFQGERLASVIKELLRIPKLAVLNLSHNCFQGAALDLILSNLIYAKKLVTFDLSSNPLTLEDALNVLTVMLRPRVKVANIFMEDVTVNKPFLALLDQVKSMKSRKKFRITYGYVLHNWTAKGPDPRDLILKRAEYLGRANKKNKKDIPVFFLILNERLTKPISVGAMMEILKVEKVHLDEDLVSELSVVFPGPKTPKGRTIDVSVIAESVHRLWPERQLPTEPEEEPEPPPPPPPPPKEKKKGKKGKK